MTREEAIHHIEQLYPADSSFVGTRELGYLLLERAKREVDWRSQPTEVLIKYAELCIEHERYGR